MVENCPYRNKCNGIDCDKDFCMRKYKLDYLYRMSLLSDKQRQYQDLWVDDDNTDLAEFRQLADLAVNVKDFVKEGKNLYLHSTTCGNGKSSWSIRFIQNYFEAIWPMTDLSCKALFISVPKFLLELKANISNRSEYVSFIQENVLDADLVIWDDLAAKIGTDFEINHLLSLIDNRISSGKSNIYTSNLSPQEMTAALGSRLQSRVCKYSIDIELHGKDKRNIFSTGGNE